MGSKLKILRPEFKLILITFSRISLIWTYLVKLFSICVRNSWFCFRQHRLRPINSYITVSMDFLNTNCFFLNLFTSSKVQHSWWHSIGRTGQHHTRCPGDGIRCRWQGNGPRSRTRSMMTSPANNAATSSIRKGHTKQSNNIKKYCLQRISTSIKFFNDLFISFNFETLSMLAIS